MKQVDEKAQSGIGAAQERASSADQHAGEAMNKATEANTAASQANTTATQADQKADKNAQGLDSLRQVVSNIDDYKMQSSVSVPFKFDRYTLTDDAKAELDKIADDIKADKRFFIAVEGYTDKTGSRQYNEALSRRRADTVVQYLVAKHDVPIYRIHMIGLGVEKPVEDASNREANAKNRRVEVKVFSADGVTASINGDAAASADRTIVH